MKMLVFFIVLFVFNPNTEKPATDNADINQNKTSIAWAAGWSYDDKYIAVGNDHGELSIYETTNWKKIKTWKYNKTTITKIEWNPKYSILAVASISYDSTNSVVQLFDVNKNETIKFLPKNMQGRGVTWSPDGQTAAFVGSKGSIGLFSKSGTHVKTLSFRNDGSLFDIDWHPIKNLMLAVEENIYVLDIDKDSLLATYDDGSKNKGILCCQWHTSGKFFVTGDYGHENEGGEPSYLKYWTVNGKLMRRVKESKYEYRNTRWSKDGKHLAATGDVLLVLNEKGALVSKTKFDNENLWGVSWNKKGDKIITSNQVGDVRITDINGKVLKTFRH